MQLDVTNDAEIDSAFATLKSWIRSTSPCMRSRMRRARRLPRLLPTARRAKRSGRARRPSYSPPPSPEPLSCSWRRAGAILTLSYLGASSIPTTSWARQGQPRGERGSFAATWALATFRVNGISAGPIKTAAAGIAGFRKMLSRVADVSPLRRNVTLEDVGNAAAFCARTRQWHHRRDPYVDGGCALRAELPAGRGEGCWHVASVPAPA